MNAYELPTTLTVGDREYAIRSDYRDILTVLASQKDEDLDSRMKALVLLKIMYPDWQDIDKDHIGDALKAAVDFIDCGYQDDGKPKPQLVDWEQDAKLIIPAINKIAGKEVRQEQYMHWWTFFSYYMEIGESLFSEVVNIRSKKAKGKKLEKYERDFYRDNKALVDIRKPESEQIREEKDSILAYLDRKR